MNIFVLSENGVLAANMMCDKHVVKMVLETAQMLSTNVLMYDPDAKGLYDMVHKNHPCTKWARQTRRNFSWLVNHGIALADVYRDRYGRTHKSEEVIRRAAGFMHHFPVGPQTEFAKAMPEKFKKNFEDVVEAYRHYYYFEKKRFAKWNHSIVPYWWNDYEYRYGIHSFEFWFGAQQ